MVRGFHTLQSHRATVCAGDGGDCGVAGASAGDAGSWLLPVVLVLLVQPHDRWLCGCRGLCQVEDGDDVGATGDGNACVQ